MSTTLKWEDLKKKLDAIAPINQDKVQFQTALVRELLSLRDTLSQEQYEQMAEQLESPQVDAALEIIFEILSRTGKTISLVPKLVLNKITDNALDIAVESKTEPEEVLV